MRRNHDTTIILYDIIILTNESKRAGVGVRKKKMQKVHKQQVEVFFLALLKIQSPTDDKTRNFLSIFCHNFLTREMKKKEK